MKKKTGSTEQWLHFIGKDKLQTFQDNFAKAYGVSMSFLDTNGNSLTVGSQNSLFCFTIEKDHAARCQENFQNDRETMQKGEPFIHVCPFGITCLYVPVFFGDKLTAIAAIGGLTYTNSNIPENLKTRFRITSYPKDQVENILQLLGSALRLLNVNTAAGFTSGSKKIQGETLPARLRDDRISRREHEIVLLLCKGLSNKQIAQQLFISETTVKTHISNILAKLNLHDRMQIIVHYYNKNDAGLADTVDSDNETI